MQQTTNYGFNKPEYTDPLDINAINGIMDDVDEKLFRLNETLALTQETNTATKAIAKGTYVFWNDGLYIASSDIDEGDTLSALNLTEVTGGGLNADPNKSKWVSGYVSIDVEIAKGSTYSTNLKTIIDNYLAENNGDFGFIKYWSVSDNHYDIVVLNAEYVDSTSSFRVRNYGTTKRYDTIRVAFTYAPKG